MNVSRTALCWIYGLTALLALVATWHQNIAYVGSADPVAGTIRFWKDTLVNPAGVSIMVDLFLLGLAVVVWMVVEARRLEIRWVWVYVVVGALVAISVSVPLFLIARERRLDELRPDLEFVTWRPRDVVGVVLFALPTLILSLWSLLH